MPELPWSALLRTPRNGLMKIILVEWKGKHRKEIQCIHSCHIRVRNLDKKCKRQRLKDFPGENKVAIVRQAADPGVELDKSF